MGGAWQLNPGGAPETMTTGTGRPSHILLSREQPLPPADGRNQRAFQRPGGVWAAGACSQLEKNFLSW